MGRIRVGPARVPSRESPEEAIALVRERGYDACEIDFESEFWMDYPWAERFGELAREHDVALSVHAPLFGWVGHLEASGHKWSSALGALDRSAGIAAACGAEVVVFHPGFLLGRRRERSARIHFVDLAGWRSKGVARVGRDSWLTIGWVSGDRVVAVAGEGVLSEREAAVLEAVARGLSNREIGRRLWISEQTVKFHLRNIYRKLGISSRTEAARYAYRNGFAASLTVESA